MKFFTKTEVIYIALILALVGLATGYNFKVGLRRSRDLTRKNDIQAIANAVSLYQNDFSFFPVSSAGKIGACGTGLSACEWGLDSLRDVNDPSYPAYMDKIPADPDSVSGLSYVYEGNGKMFQILAHLEGADEDEYNPEIEDRKVMCGNKYCNFGKASGNTPLDKSVAAYQAELDAIEEARRKELLKKGN